MQGISDIDYRPELLIFLIISISLYYLLYLIVHNQFSYFYI